MKYYPSSSRITQSVVSTTAIITISTCFLAYVILTVMYKRRLIHDEEIKRRHHKKTEERERERKKEKKKGDAIVAEHLQKVIGVASARNREQREMERIAERERERQEPQELVDLGMLVETLIDYETGTCKWDKLIAIGDVYQRGSFPRFLPDQDMAVQCYKIAAMSPDGKFAGMAQTKYIEARTTDIPDEDKAGAKIPEHFGRRACKLAYDVFAKTPMSMFEKPKCKKKEKEENADGENPPLPPPPVTTTMFHHGGGFGADADIQEALIRDAERIQRNLWYGGARVGAGVAPRRMDVAAFKHDAQNVHDHGISTVIDYNLRQLQQDSDTDTDNKNDKSAEVRRAIMACRDLTPAQREDALFVLNGLGSNPHSTFGTSEREALATVWNKIKESDHRDNLTETLAKQLASGVERGSAVCSSGKIARIVSTLDGVTNEAAPRPMWVVREEIGSLAGKVRDEVGEDAHEDVLKEAFGKRVRDEYVQKLGMSPQIMEPIIDEFSAGF
jgi:hypothetical protein